MAATSGRGPISWLFEDFTKKVIERKCPSTKLAQKIWQAMRHRPQMSLLVFISNQNDGQTLLDILTTDHFPSLEPSLASASFQSLREPPPVGPGTGTAAFLDINTVFTNIFNMAS